MGSIEVEAGLLLELGQKVDRLSRRTEHRPIYRTVFGYGTSVQPAGSFNNFALVQCTQRPAAGRIWNLRAVTILAGNNVGLGTLTQGPAGANVIGYFLQGFTATVAAAAAGSLTVATAEVQSWRIDPAAAWPAGVNQVTITQLQGGTQTYDLPGGTTNSLIVNYSPAMQAPFGNAVINVPAITGGPAYTINAVGYQLGNGIFNTAADLFAGEPDIAWSQSYGVQDASNIGGLIQSNLGPMPYATTFPKGVFWVHPGESLYMVVSAMAGLNVPAVLIARVEEYPSAAVEAMHIS